MDNLGFHLYREESGERIRVTPRLVAGTALLAGRTRMTAGYSYAWWDTSLSDQQSAISSQLKYYLEDIDLKGKRTLHGPIMPVVSNEPLPQKVQTEVLGELGRRNDERYGEFWEIQEIEGKLRQKPLRGDQQWAVSNQRSALSPQSSVLGAVGQAATASAGAEALKAAPVTLAAPSQQDLSKQWEIAGKAAVKISVKQEGWYRVTQPELIAAGLGSKINPAYLQLYVDGREQPILVTGDNDKTFGPQDGIEFYGTGLDTPSTDTRVYWLVVGSKAGKRGQQVVSKSSGQVGPGSFPFTVQREDREIFAAALKNGDADNFFAAELTGAEPPTLPIPVKQLLKVSNFDASGGNAMLEVAIQGFTFTPHQVKVWFNDVEVGEVVFEGQTRGGGILPISSSLILQGNNLVTLVAEGGEEDLSLLDYLRLTYWHTYTADLVSMPDNPLVFVNEPLEFTAQAGKQVSVSGFTDRKIRVIDITDPGVLVEVIGKVQASGAGYSVTLTVPGSGSRTMLAFTEGLVKRPAVKANQPSRWNNGDNRADFVIIAHRDFVGSVAPLEALREQQGLTTVVVDVEDLYDEFNFGVKSPQALKDFLLRAKTYWRKAPRFVLLGGVPVLILATTGATGIWILYPRSWWRQPQWRRPRMTGLWTLTMTGCRRWRLGGYRLKRLQKRLRLLGRSQATREQRVA